MIKMKKVALDRLRVRKNVLFVIISIRTKCTNTATRKPTKEKTTMAALQTTTKC